MTDPSGQDGLPAACGQTSYTADAAGAAGCVQQAQQQQDHANTLQALWAIPNLVLLDPLRDAFGPNKGVGQRFLGLLAVVPFVGWGGRALDLSADIARGLTEARDVEATLRTAESAPVALQGENAEPLVEFAHGTTHELGLDIVNNGLSAEANRAAEFGSKEPGSFFTIRVNPANPYEALSTAASWGARRGGSVSVVMLRLPQSVVESLEAAGSLVHSTVPVESIFRPASFETVNRVAQWDILPIRGEP